MALKEPSFAERQQTAAKAKQLKLEKIRATAHANEASLAERRAAMVEAAKAQQIRTAERKLANRLASEKREAERAAEKKQQALAAAEEKARKEAELAAKLISDAALLKEQKALRDSKYAARKARKN